MAKALRKSSKNIPKLSRELCDKMLKDLERARRPKLEAIKCSLDNTIYSPSLGYLKPSGKMVKTELNVSSVQKLARTAFILNMMLENLEVGGVHTKREFYYIAKGYAKANKELKPLDFTDQSESDSIINFICDLLEIYREEFNCYGYCN